MHSPYLLRPLHPSLAAKTHSVWWIKMRVLQSLMCLEDKARKVYQNYYIIEPQSAADKQCKWISL